LVQFIGSRLGHERCLWGTNGLPWKPSLDQVEQLGLRDEARRNLLADNAIRLFKL
jgi:predicted TIM-barrel fold metal-dependent hydrolase